MIGLPLSPSRVHCVERPSIVTCSRGNRACVPKTLPVRFWQALQWHIEMRTGSPSQVTLSFPQLHEPARDVIARPIPPIQAQHSEKLPLSLVEDHRHDQILLVIEVADEEFQQPLARIGIEIGRCPPRVVVALPSS